MSAQALVVEMYRAIERAEGRGSVDRARKAARAAGAEFSNSESSRWLKNFVKLSDGQRDRQRTDKKPEIKHESVDSGTDNGRANGLTRGYGTPVEDQDTTGTIVPSVSPTPTLFGDAEPAPKPVKKAKPVRLISAYAGTTLESFGDMAPLVVEVLAVDRHGVETKAFATALETLAMWRAMHGDDALAYGLGEAASRRKGHRYAGPIIRDYEPGSGGKAPRGDYQADLEPAPGSLAATGERGTPAYDIPGWDRPPNHPRYYPRTPANEARFEADRAAGRSAESQQQSA